MNPLVGPSERAVRAEDPPSQPGDCARRRWPDRGADPARLGPSADDGRSGREGALYIHVIFKVGVIVSDFEKTLSTLKERGADIAFGPFPARPGQRANVIVRDNAGNLIQFFGNESKE